MAKTEDPIEILIAIIKIVAIATIGAIIINTLWKASV